MIFGLITAFSAVAAAVITILHGSFGDLRFLWLMLGSFAGCFVALMLVACLFLIIACAFVDLSKPQTEDSKFFRTIFYPYITFLKQIVGMTIYAEGLEKTPKDGRFLLV